ncbi:MAG: FkbM family methyltransferase [Bacteroidia bacterium]|nr:FkbM family methyltransferase [Bacteroidia bacterium]
MNKGAIRLYFKLKKKNFKPGCICEVGVYLPEESNLLGFIKDDIDTTLVEADPEYIKKIRNYFSDRKNVKIIEAAIFDYHGKIELCRRESSTFISQLEASPAMINDNYQINDPDKFMADSLLFDEIDEGKFDLISIDIEGAEWYVIKHMISRPEILSVETHGKYYTNPNIKEIMSWTKSNGYISWYKDESDTVFIKKGVFIISLIEQFQLKLKNISICLLKSKKVLKRMLQLNHYSRRKM